MNNENVSAPLMDKISLYIELLWTTSRGVLFPHLLGKAPYYLKEAVLNSMFGFHLCQHPLLQHCHKDLARQMASHMKTLIFFPEDVVVYAGDIDNCMYFIHKGEVHVLNEDTLYSEKLETILYAEDMFGLEQGLYLGNGHEYTYKVVEYSIIISLCRDDWIYLLDFFPASKNVIYDRTVTL
ncbi:cyclic nucleotide-gated cation channel subunit a [Holotrichia oblita]|uniref:Cyclic nucleotide-gated cation channel subunit a n=2 Tax=Holotrichia oblita TaxID=644536 RepID=A0ACB9SLQ2_HOLOL|nr:cyclic nucleotide-gated cation channel subunit a [Holotrichia oblita]KAI4456101.1 cyclic nucleotide-gated cation channel subunit a [Holotrichia oblita]